MARANRRVARHSPARSSIMEQLEPRALFSAGPVLPAQGCESYQTPDGAAQLGAPIRTPTLPTTPLAPNRSRAAPGVRTCDPGRSDRNARPTARIAADALRRWSLQQYPERFELHNWQKPCPAHRRRPLGPGSGGCSGRRRSLRYAPGVAQRGGMTATAAELSPRILFQNPRSEAGKAPGARCPGVLGLLIRNTFAASGAATCGRPPPSN